MRGSEKGGWGCEAAENAAASRSQVVSWLSDRSHMKKGLWVIGEKAKRWAADALQAVAGHLPRQFLRK